MTQQGITEEEALELWELAQYLESVIRECKLETFRSRPREITR